MIIIYFTLKVVGLSLTLKNVILFSEKASHSSTNLYQV